MKSVRRYSIVLFAAVLFCGCGSSTGPSPAEGDKLTGPWDVVLLDTATGQPTGPTIRQHNQIVALALAADEKSVVVSCRKALPGPQAEQQANSNDQVDPTHTGILRVWSTETGEVVTEREYPDTLHSFVWMAPQGKQFLTATSEYPARHFFSKNRFLLWDYSSGEIEQVARLEFVPRSNRSVAFAADGKTIVISGDIHDTELDKENVTRDDIKAGKAIWVVRRWKIEGGKPVATKQVGLGTTATRNADEMIARAHISADGSRMITLPPGSNRIMQPSYQLWDLQSLEPIGEPIALQKGQLAHYLNFDGTRIFSSMRMPGEKNVSSYQIIEAESGKPLGRAVGDLLSLQAVFAGDGKSLLVQTHQEPDLWHLRLFNADGNEVWKSRDFQSPRFIAGVSRRNNIIAYAEFPPYVSAKKD